MKICYQSGLRLVVCPSSIIIVWWKEVKKLSGMSPALETRANTSKLLQHLGFSPGALANYINSAFLTPVQIFEPLTHNPFDPPQANNESHAVNMISEFSTFMKLSALNPSKAHGPDGIPAWLLKENADLLAGPFSAILSLRSWRYCVVVE